jgi:hypothetical protein
MAITTQNGLYYYKGIPYTNLQDAKNAEMGDSSMTIKPNMPAPSGIPTQPQRMTNPTKYETYGLSPQPSNLLDMSVNQGRPAPKFTPQPRPDQMMQDMTPASMKSQPQTPSPAPSPEMSFMDRLTSKQGIGAIGNAMLSMSQDPRLQQMGVQNLQKMQEQKSELGKVNKTIAMLRQRGENKLADFIEANPTMAKTALTQWLQQTYGARSGIKTSAVMTDPKTGQQYVVETDPNTGSINRRNVEGAFGETPEAKTARATQQELTLADMKRSQAAAADTYKQFSNISSQIRNLETIKAELNTGNARTGIVDQFLPAFSEATATLRSAANSLGIDVINSATFGALSATELKLALDTALPQGLDEPELLQWVNKKLEAQKKLQREIAKQADRLASGVPYTEWVKDVVKPFATAPQAQSSGGTIEVDF